MKRHIFTLVLLAVMAAFSIFANGEKRYVANNDSCELLASNDFKKWFILAATWSENKKKWLHPQYIYICWKPNTGLYMWEYGGITTPVKSSNIDGYDWMVIDGKLRFYFKDSDLKW